MRNTKLKTILAIETSCDETSVAIVRFGKKDVQVLHHETATQIPIHQRYGGVVPEVAARTHVAELVSLLERSGIFGEGMDKKTGKQIGKRGGAVKSASKKKLYDAIAVTKGPGLGTALRVGIEAGRTLAAATGKPIVGVNHLEGHLASAWLVPENRARWKFPILILLVSGGHTEIVLLKDFCSYKILGRTRDDAAGEAFDKTGKLMGLEYPGGPVIARLAKEGNPTAFELPRPMLQDPSFDFSFSGLKTAVRQMWEGLPAKKRNDKQVVADLAASVQQAIVDVLVEKTLRAARKVRPTAIAIVGGVSANQLLQDQMGRMVKEQLSGVQMMHPAKGFHTDNAAMIAAAASWRLTTGKTDSWKKLDAAPELDL